MTEARLEEALRTLEQVFGDRFKRGPVRGEGPGPEGAGLDREGEPDAEVVSLGEEIGASMIVTGSRGLGRMRRPIGSVSSSIAVHAHCPVLVVRGGA